ncbi:MAG TPA: hypothetical protein VGN16_22490 [Acidobacteriaceae bacterium]|jgi:hypothetical protein
MNFSTMEAVADAVLFEGYILYPYRPSAIKNRQRWNFGTLYPRLFAEAQSPPERWRFRAQIMLQADADARLSARLRFLQLVAPGEEGSESWEEGFARSRTLEDLSIAELADGVKRVFYLDMLTEEDGAAPKTFHVKPRRGRLTLRAEACREGLYRLHAEFGNESPAPVVQTFSRRLVQDTAFTSAHLLLAVEGGTFVSLLEPLAEFEADSKACVQEGVFPVLAGEKGDNTRALCSPIILYDYPEVAPESAGNFFDGTEMDEMLALRVRTLTDEEKEAMRRGDPHARAILERTETLPDEQLARVHGAVRGLRRITEHDFAAVTDAAIDMIEQPFDPFAEHLPVTSVRVFGIELRTGDRVRLWPQKKADILDMEMEGKVAVIEAIEQDFEDNVQFAVVLEDDPGRDMGMLRQTGHRFFFSPDEVEPLGMEAL